MTTTISMMTMKMMSWIENITVWTGLNFVEVQRLAQDRLNGRNS